MTDSQLERVRIVALTYPKPPEDWREMLNDLLELVDQQQYTIDELESNSVDVISDSCDCEDLAEDVAGMNVRLRAIEKLIKQAAKEQERTL